MPEGVIPPVVAVVTTSEPGEYLEACLDSLRRQDYPNLAVLVVDDASTTEVAARVAAVHPGAILRKRPVRGGCAAAADEALVGIEGAAFFLFCHDDVALAEGATRALVEESFRSNAAIVSPKLLSADEGHHILQLGLGMHRLGTPAERVERGELDQAQHDEVREVFAAPGACMLVRADLFEALGGFDATMEIFGEDVDFCWRAQVAGARVVVAPAARVRHREVAAAGGRDLACDPAELQHRHEIRSALKCYGRVRRPLVISELLVLAVVEAITGLLAGERDRARRVARVWRWNLAHRKSLREERRRLRQLRQVPDRRLVARMVGPSRLRRHFASNSWSGLEGEHLDLDRIEAWWNRGERPRISTGQLAGLLAVLLVGVFATRDVLLARIPPIGGLVPMPNAISLLSAYVHGVAVPGGTRPAPPGYGVVGVIGLVLGNSSAAALKAITLGSLFLGTVGAARVASSFGARRAGIVAAVAFLALPLAWNSLATGDLQACVTLGALPYVFTRLARASGCAPFAREMPDSASRRFSSFLGEVAPLGLLLALVAALAPAGVLAVAVTALAVVFGALLAGRPRGAGRSLLVVLAAGAVAFACCLPWSATFFESGARWSALSGVVPTSPIPPADLLTGHLGPVGGVVVVWGLVAAAGYVLFVGRRARLTWSTAWWLAALFSVTLAWAGSEGWLGAGGGDARVLSAPAAVAVAVCCGLGAAAFELDVVADAALGWRQAGALLAAAALLVGVAPAVAVAAGGRGGLPASGFSSELDLTRAGVQRSEVLWLGDPRALPGAGWQLARGLSYSVSRGVPGAAEEWPSANPGASAPVAAAVAAARSGATEDLGRLLAPYGVRYVVVPTADAPDVPGEGDPPLRAPPPAGLAALLSAQDDLVALPAEPGALVFENADWTPRDGVGLRGAFPRLPSPLGAPELALGLLVVALCLGEVLSRRSRLGVLGERAGRRTGRLVAAGSGVGAGSGRTRRGASVGG